LDPPFPDESTTTPPNDGWPDYVARHGLTQGDVPALLSLLEVRDPDAWDDATWSACVRARRALSQLRAAEAVPVLLAHMGLTDEAANEHGEATWALSGLGPVAVPALLEHLQQHPRAQSMADALMRIGMSHPMARDAAVAFFAHRLEHPGDDRPRDQAFFIEALAYLDAQEYVELVRSHFEGLRFHPDAGWYTEQTQTLWAFFNRVDCAN